MRKQHGFTLIELLVVIAIIAILAAILFPVFAKAREKARQSACQSNLKQLTLGILQYCQDYDEKFPGRVVWADYPDYTQGEFRRWYKVIQPYLKNEQILKCPSRSSGTVNYGYNIYNRTGPPTGLGSSLAEVVSPASIVLVLDCTSAWGYTANRPFDDGSTSCFVAYYDGTHNEGQNVGHIDGHVKWYRPVTLWNNRNDVPYWKNP